MEYLRVIASYPAQSENLIPTNAGCNTAAPHYWSRRAKTLLFVTRESRSFRVKETNKAIERGLYRRRRQVSRTFYHQHRCRRCHGHCRHLAPTWTRRVFPIGLSRAASSCGTWSLSPPGRWRVHL